jgi:hypothetical protein
MAQRGRAATKRFSQKETKETKIGKNFAKNAEFPVIALQRRNSAEAGIETGSLSDAHCLMIRRDIEKIF